MEEKLFSGLKVVELATYVAAPTCGKLLADLGAEVIKVEAPPYGDAWRYGVESAQGRVNARFEVCNSGKKSVLLDLKSEDGRAAMEKLIAGADIFLTNTRGKSLRKLGLDHGTLRARYPRLIYAWLTAYGPLGAEADAPGFDSVAFWARAGYTADMSVQTDDSYPALTPLGAGDTMTGTMLYATILTALLRRSVTGEGDFVTTSLYNAGIWAACGMIAVAHNDPHYGPVRREKCSPECSPYLCADGEWVMCCILEYDRYAPALHRALGYPDLLQNPRFDTPEKRHAHNEEIMKLFAASFAQKTAAEWLEILSGLDIVCTRLNHYAEVADDEQAWVNGYLQRVEYPNGEEYVYPCPPFRMESQQPPLLTGAPKLGQDTEEVLARLKEQ